MLDFYVSIKLSNHTIYGEHNDAADKKQRNTSFRLRFRQICSLLCVDAYARNDNDYIAADEMFRECIFFDVEKIPTKGQTGVIKKSVRFSTNFPMSKLGQRCFVETNQQFPDCSHVIAFQKKSIERACAAPIFIPKACQRSYDLLGMCNAIK